jgi:hypothetical protein
VQKGAEKGSMKQGEEEGKDIGHFPFGIFHFPFGFVYELNCSG